MPFRFQKPDLSFRRERVIDVEQVQTAPDPVETRPDVVSVDRLQDMANRAVQLQAKAQILLNALKDANKQIFIPVPEQNLDVRSAVRRLEGAGDGSVITYDLYQKLVSQPYEQVERIDAMDLARELTGEVLVDSRTIVERSGEPRLWPYLAQFGVILMANRLMGMFSGPEQAAKDATKLPPGTEVPKLIEQLVTSWLAWRLVQGLQSFEDSTNEFDFGTVFQETFGNIDWEKTREDVRSIVQQGAELSVGDSLFGQRDADRDMALRFTSNFLSKTPRPEYEGWVRIPQIRDIQHRMQVSERVNSWWQDFTTIGEQVTDVPADMLRGLLCEVGDANEALNRAAASLRSRFSRRAVCCLMRVMSELSVKTGDINLEWVSTVRNFLTFYIGANSVFGVGFSVDAAVQVNRSWESLLRQSYKRAVLGLSRGVFHKFSDPLIRFMRDPALETLRICTPFNDLLEILLQAVEAMEEQVRNQLLGLYEDVELAKTRSEQIDLKLPLVQRARAMIEVFDALEGFIKTGAICSRRDAGRDGSEPRQDDYIDFVRSQENASAPQIVLPEPVGDPFVDFEPVSWETDGIRVPSQDDEDLDPDEGIVQAVKDCFKQVQAETIPQIPALRELR